jgi:hypothetical protein
MLSFFHFPVCHLTTLFVFVFNHFVFCVDRLNKNNLDEAKRRKKGDRKIDGGEELTSVEGRGQANHGKGTRQDAPIPQMDI